RSNLRPFVLRHEPVVPERSGDLDLYLPDATPAPAVLMVHGGPVSPDGPVRPPQWPALPGVWRAAGASRARRRDGRARVRGRRDAAACSRRCAVGTVGAARRRPRRPRSAGAVVLLRWWLPHGVLPRASPRRGDRRRG